MIKKPDARIKCPVCGGLYRRTADGTINAHGPRTGPGSPKCGWDVAPQHAQCSLCRLVFETGEGFDAHRQHGKCVHPYGLGYEEKDGVWSKIPGLRT